MAIDAAPDAFESEFCHPEKVQSLHQLLNLVLEETTFARVASICQSSGWGKSRIICELHRQQVWVIYLTFTRGSGYPRRSSMADWFLGRANALITGDIKGQLACMAFFLAFMEACLEELLMIQATPRSNPRDFVRMLYKSGDKASGEGAQGIEFWNNVRKRVDVLVDLFSAQGLDCSTEETREACWADWELRAGIRVNDVVAKLEKVLSTDEFEVKVLFVFDEARVLVPEALETNLFLPLRRATSAFNPSTGILAVFADTTSKLANFAAPVWLDKSDRMPGTSLRMAPPIWACFWADYGVAEDDEWKRICSEYGISPEDVLSQYWTVRYGRPLWWGTFKAGLSYGVKAALQNVVCLARDKLLGGHGGWDKYRNGAKPVLLTEAAALAVLGSRCALHIDPHCSMVSELVASHMMSVVKVNQSRECVWATFPMEPVVAEAGSKIMQELDSQNRNSELYLPLCVALKAGWIHKGYKGELLTRLIMLRAFDKAVMGKRRSWCTVDELVQALVGKSLLQLGREQEQEARKKLNVNSEVVEESLFTEELKQVAERKLCFNAFYKIGKASYEVTPADLRGVAERRCAIVADENTWGVDHFYVDEKGEVAIQQQVKAKQADYGLADMAKESPAFCGLPDTGAYLDLHTNVENVGSGKVTLVDAKRVERAVLEQNRKSKVLTAVLESQEAASGDQERKRARWEKQRDKHPRLFKAWQDWFDMSRRNQVILKVNGLEAFRPLLGDQLFNLLAAMMEHGPLLDPASKFESKQAASVNQMFLREFKA